MNKTNIIQRLRPSIQGLLTEVESRTNLGIIFEQLSSEAAVMAQYYFNTNTNTPKVSLRSDWEDVDVAHELMHMWLELVDGYSVLAWRAGVNRTQEAEAAFGRIGTYIDDEVVHARLRDLGLRVDGEILRPALFDEIYTRVPRYLNKLRPPRDDGMAHLDQFGYGELCRSSFLVQAELLLQNYKADIISDHQKKVRRFIEAFRTHRSTEAAKADEVLTLFAHHDVQSVHGHKEILWAWARMEQLDRFVGVSTYARENGWFILPWP